MEGPTIPLKNKKVYNDPENKWLVVRASVQGHAHVINNIPCQDSHLVKKIPDNNWILCAVSDGAGSCKYSHIGSKKILEFVDECFSELIKCHSTDLLHQNLLISPEKWHLLSKQTLKRVYHKLQDYAKENDYTIKDLSATLIVVIVTPIGLLVCNIGDGRAGFRNINSGEWESMIIPYKGEYANETIFLTSDIWQDDIIDNYISSKVVVNPFDAFVIMSDGCEDVAYQTTIWNEEENKLEYINKPFGGFLDPMVEVIKKAHKEKISEEKINLLWQEYLKNGTEKLASEPDDKTLIIGIKI